MMEEILGYCILVSLVGLVVILTRYEHKKKRHRLEHKRRPR